MTFLWISSWDDWLTFLITTLSLRDRYKDDFLHFLHYGRAIIEIRTYIKLHLSLKRVFQKPAQFQKNLVGYSQAVIKFFIDTGISIDTPSQQRNKSKCESKKLKYSNFYCHDQNIFAKLYSSLHTTYKSALPIDSWNLKTVTRTQISGQGNMHKPTSDLSTPGFKLQNDTKHLIPLQSL